MDMTRVCVNGRASCFLLGINVLSRANRVDNEPKKCRTLLWAGHVARMPKSRLPKRLMLSWVHEPRIAGGQEMTYGRSLERHLKYFGLVDDGGKAITSSEWETLAQDRAGWLKLVTKAPFNIGKPQLRPRCGTRVTTEEKRRFLARRAQETEQRRALFNAETDAETA